METDSVLTIPIHVFLPTALQRMVIDCAHYVAQLIWVIGETNNKQLLV